MSRCDSVASKTIQDEADQSQISDNVSGQAALDRNHRKHFGQGTLDSEQVHQLSMLQLYDKPAETIDEEIEEITGCNNSPEKRSKADSDQKVVAKLACAEPITNATAKQHQNTTFQTVSSSAKVDKTFVENSQLTQAHQQLLSTLAPKPGSSMKQTG